jgi:HlyD family secretion protein
VSSIKYLKIFFDDKSLTVNIISLQFLFIFSSLLELAGISLIGPLFYVLSTGQGSLSNEYLNYLYTFLDLDSFNEFSLFFSLITITIIILGGIFSILSVILLTRVATYGGVYLGNRLFDLYLKKKWVFYLENNKSMMINEIYQETSRVTQNVLIPALMLNKAIYLTLFILTMLMVVDIVLTISFFLGLSIIYLIIYFLFRKNLNRNSKNLTESHEARFKYLDDTFSSIKVIHIWKNRNIFLRGFDEASRKWSIALRNNTNITNLPRYIVETFILVLICLSFLSISFNSPNINASLASYSVFFFSSLKLLPAIQQIYYASSMISGNSYSVENLFNIFNNQEEERINETKFNSDIISVDLNNVSFTHQESGFSLKNINLNLTSGNIFGITGFSGSGKSTLVDILMGLLNPEKGSIIVNGVESEIYESDDWFERIAYLPQEITLTDSSLAQNIHFKDTGDIDFEKFSLASKQSNLEDFTNKITKNNFKELSYGNLSGGQVQRIGIARTLYKEADIIFFDEPTSALDNINKNYFIKQIQKFKRNKLIIVVTHDIELLSEVDNLVVLNNGSLEYLGSFSSSIEESQTMKNLLTKND